jgi:hypothetical protein
MRKVFVGVVAGAFALGGCGDSSVYSSGLDEPARSQVRSVVLRNLASEARGDGPVYCSTWSAGYLKQTYGGYRRCVARFKRPPDRHAEVPKPTFIDFLHSTDGHAMAELRVGGGNVQSFKVDRVGGRWLIDEVGVERD